MGIKWVMLFRSQHEPPLPASKLSGALWWWGGKRKESLQLRLQNLNSSSNSPVAPHRLSCQISANQHKADKQARILTNIEKHVPRAMTSDSLLMSSQPISISHQLFWCRYSISRDRVASSPSFSCPAARAPWRACVQARAPRGSYTDCVTYRTFNLLLVESVNQF